MVRTARLGSGAGDGAPYRVGSGSQRNRWFRILLCVKWSAVEAWRRWAPGRVHVASVCRECHGGWCLTRHRQRQIRALAYRAHSLCTTRQGSSSGTRLACCASSKERGRARSPFLSLPNAGPPANRGCGREAPAGRESPATEHEPPAVGSVNDAAPENLHGAPPPAPDPSPESRSNHGFDSPGFAETPPPAGGREPTTAGGSSSLTPTPRPGWPLPSSGSCPRWA